MTSKPTYTKHPISHPDLSALPPGARNRGQEALTEASLFHFAAQHANKRQQAAVIVNDKEISVLQVKPGASSLGHIIPILQAGHIKDALPLLEALSEREPNNPAVLFYLGRAHCDLGHFEAGLAHLQHAARLDPDHAHTWTAIGVAYKQMGKHELALEPLLKAVEADPKDG